ncbi:MAG: MBL fold metallo-hydrolase, partial [Candidatus Buchananbacteria bacterium]
MNKIRKIIINFYLVILAGLVLVIIFLFFQLQPVNLKIYFLAVGQGDSILIQTPNRYHILIDGGPDNTVLYRLGKYLPFYERQIDLVVLTHPDSDHLNGLIEVLKRYQVKNILLTEIFDDSPAYKIFWQIINEKKVSIFDAGKISGINLGKDSNLTILYPTRSLAELEFKDKNDSSIVVKLNYFNFSSLFMGDAPIKIEKNLLADSKPVLADVLKLGHHGSNTCSDQNFLTQVKPELAIISVGQNKFGHPSPAVLQ